MKVIENIDDMRQLRRRLTKPIGFVPKHAKQYAKLADIMSSAITEYYNEVKAGTFPTDKQSFSIDESVLAGLK